MTPMRLSMLVAMARNRVIGQGNQLPWHLPADLKYFKSLTMGHAIVMGRQTYESIGRPLPGRINIVITRQVALKIPGVIVVNSIEGAVQKCQENSAVNNNESFIIGGENLYRQTLQYCQRLYITEIQKDFEGDVFFPELNLNDWEETQRDKHFSEDNDTFEYHFVILNRKV